MDHMNHASKVLIFSVKQSGAIIVSVDSCSSGQRGLDEMNIFLLSL